MIEQIKNYVPKMGQSSITAAACLTGVVIISAIAQRNIGVYIITPITNWSKLDIIRITPFKRSLKRILEAEKSLRYPIKYWVRKNIFRIESSRSTHPAYMQLFTVLHEELFYRVFVQQFLMRVVPFLILSRISPQNADLVDSQYAKIARVVLSSLYFGYSHFDNWENGSLNNMIIGGLEMGGLYEYTGSILPSMIFHYAHNST